MGEALLGGVLAGVVFCGIRWPRGFSQRMNERPVDDDLDREVAGSEEIP